VQQEPLPFLDVEPIESTAPRRPKPRPVDPGHTPTLRPAADDLADDDPDDGDAGDGDIATTADERWPFEVRVVRSQRRKRTVGAQMKGNVLVVTVPSWMSRAEEAVWRDRMADRYRRRIEADRIDLRERSTTLARRYDLPRPREIRWADDMTSQWGSCTPSTSTIRLSSRLAAFPNWVLDYVIVHELAHLVVLGHNDEFWKIVHQYPKAERAIGYLIARSNDTEDID